uniref:Uncharacterized protein n=1 Tax=Glossina brevipalpis TaxID=37001 RepID=A0A1A9VZZ5_9MUSC
MHLMFTNVGKPSFKQRVMIVPTPDLFKVLMFVFVVLTIISHLKAKVKRNVMDLPKSRNLQVCATLTDRLASNITRRGQRRLSLKPVGGQSSHKIVYRCLLHVSPFYTAGGITDLPNI